MQGCCRLHVTSANKDFLLALCNEHAYTIAEPQWTRVHTPGHSQVSRLVLLAGFTQLMFNLWMAVESSVPAIRSSSIRMKMTRIIAGLRRRNRTGFAANRSSTWRLHNNAETCQLYGCKGLEPGLNCQAKPCYNGHVLLNIP